MKHIIDTDELEKLPRYDHETAGEWAGMVEKNDGDFIRIADLRALIANSPQADGMVLTSEMISAGAVPINNWNNRNRKNKTPISPMERVIAHQVFDAMKAAYKPQADDVRKDAERYRWIRANPRLDICGTDEIAEFDAMIDRAMGKARE